ncbi:uncharacterized protein LOC107823831 [Nicotiana tabacum]|uniref:Uncharacterized protein LOC107823831 n=1 Tax=Nicotiana tabacum TaxID=4097 RepID=A0AC58TJ73_TOBAC
MPIKSLFPMQHFQTVETSSSNPAKVKGVRRRNKCKEVASLEVGQKLKVTFYNNRMVGIKSKLFSRHLGRIVHDCNMCPLGVSSWNDIKQEKLNHMRAAIEVLKIEATSKMQVWKIHKLIIILLRMLCKI